MAEVRNVAIVAHVDHGKTTLVDRLLYQSGMFRSEELDRMAGGIFGLIMDSNPLERERGITILSKNCAVIYHALDGQEYRINIIDTPGHADFGGEVERVLQMADGVLLLVDAFDGPMPQTRFVLTKALELNLKPVVVVNKVDRPGARPEAVVEEVFDLLVDLGAEELALDFPIVYASAREGWASLSPSEKGPDLREVFEAIVRHVPAPAVRPDEPLQMLVTSLDYSDYVGRIAIGRVSAGRIRAGSEVAVIGESGVPSTRKVVKLLRPEGLDRREVDEVVAGDVCALVGLEPVGIGDTVADVLKPVALPRIKVDEPTIDMIFRVNDGPFAGRDGTYVTTRQIKARLEKELQSNVALRVEPGETTEEFRVSGRGLMHLGILIENMRREGYEICAGRPRVIMKEINGKLHEPIERLVVDCPSSRQSSVMSLLGERRAEVLKMEARAGTDFLHMEFRIPARGLIGLRSRLLTATQGEAIMHHVFDGYEPVGGSIPQRQCGVMISMIQGTVTPFALDLLYDRGSFFVRPGDMVYEGQIVGEVGTDSDIEVNPAREKRLTNMRAAGKDDNSRVRPPKDMQLEQALEYIKDDELVEVTPKSVRLRKRHLKEHERRKAKSAKQSA